MCCADAGLFAIDAADIRPLVINNIWLVVKFWYAFEQASHPSQPISEATGRRGVRQVLALLKPYVTATLRPAFIAACARAWRSLSRAGITSFCVRGLAAPPAHRYHNTARAQLLSTLGRIHARRGLRGMMEYPLSRRCCMPRHVCRQTNEHTALT